jgi:peptide/nickel transport system ATP-binding protein
MTGAMLEVRGVSKTFASPATFGSGLWGAKSRPALRALHHVDLSVHRGEIFAIVGESGCGKSTLARVITGLMTPSGGSVFFEGVAVHDRAAFERHKLRQRMQIVFQNPFGSLDPRMRVGDIVAEPLIIHRRSLALTRSDIDRRVEATLGECGLDPTSRARFPHQFSGGQRQRIAIARALVLRPSLLVLDEPVSALDVSIQAQIINLLRAKQREHALTYLFISHDLSLIGSIATRAAVMYLGRICEIGDVGSVFGHPRHHYTRGLLDAVPDIRARTKRPAPVMGEVPNPLHPPPGCVFHTRCPAARERCRSEEPALRQMGHHQLVACHYPLGDDAGTG